MTVPAQQFYDDRKVRVQTDFDAIIQHLGRDGLLRNTEKFRLLADGVWEMKSHDGPGWRLYCVYGESDSRVRQLFVTHGKKKPKDKRVSAEVARALAIFADRRRS